MSRIWQIYQLVSALVGILIGAAMFCGLCMKAFAADSAVLGTDGASSFLSAVAESAAVTNVYLVSDTAVSKAWTRQAVMATPSNRVMDLSGKIVEAAEAAVQSNEAERISAVSDAAISGVRTAFQALYAVTGNIPETAYHVALTLPPGVAPASLMGYTVKEETDGVTDTMWVWYSQTLAAAPVRHVEYWTPAGRFSQPVTWIGWTSEGETLEIDGRTWTGCHKCTATRPESARNVRLLTRNNETFGGPGGFDFGAALVTVGGVAAWTGVLTNDVTGEVLTFDNGVLKKGDAKDAE